MDHDHEWLFSQPKKNLMVNMINYKDEQYVFDAITEYEKDTIYLRKPTETGRKDFHLSPYWLSFELIASI